MKSLVVGMGIGELYKTVLSQLGYTVITVDSDPDKASDFTSVESALAQHDRFDTVHICTPNFTHARLAAQLAPHADIVFIEKPGVAHSENWLTLVHTFKHTRFMMVKNNQWRMNISALQQLASQANAVEIQWIRRNCIPSPGSWFTTRELAYGGVSRDLMPHLLSLYTALNPDWRQQAVTKKFSEMRWRLEDIDTTDYGVINRQGTYDVDDFCEIAFGDKWQLTANWRSMQDDSSCIRFIMQDQSVAVYDLGWCPENAYKRMIADCVANLNNEEFWQDQLEQDFFIHESIQNL
jgi:predicted dehydrogenase